jgi:UDP-N-acetylmuramoyl-L-alanyl-D-glutamate--2,6-diaminopimelate ligase
MPQTLAHHLANLPAGSIIARYGNQNISIEAPFVESSRDVRQGGVFVARRGDNVDGHRFILQALEAGAVAIVGESHPHELPNLPTEIPYIHVFRAQNVLGHLAASYHDFPSRKLTLVGITGTDGKTTTSHILHSILAHATQGKAGFISTIAADFGGAKEPTGLHVTTPGAPQVQEYLARMVSAGLTHVVLEMTSHGLAQGRLVGVDLDAAVLTNITHEHLDYHGTWEAYREAKGIMFGMLAQAYRKPDVPKIAIINQDDPSFSFMRNYPQDVLASYAIDAPAEYQAQQIRYEPDGTYFVVNDTPYSANLVGAFNVYNLLAAIATARALGIDEDPIQTGIASVTAIDGRMERIDEGQNFTAIVDFAHTPNALKRALEAGRTMLPEGKRLIAVFGSAGLRDVAKRRLMAETSAQLADMTILTAEDPRTESLDAILEMMAEGCRSQGGVEGETFIRVHDRGEALLRACLMAQAGDIVMACGKGHEQSMCFGEIEYDWDDRIALRSALRGKAHGGLPTSS